MVCFSKTEQEGKTGPVWRLVPVEEGVEDIRKGVGG
jgi:hypothetical protein